MEFSFNWFYSLGPSNVSALPGETWTPEIVFFQSCKRLENDTALACYIYDTHQPTVILFVDNKLVLLSTVCKYYLIPSHFCAAAHWHMGQHPAESRRRRQWPVKNTAACMREGKRSSLWTFAINNRFFSEPPTAQHNPLFFRATGVQ